MNRFILLAIVAMLIAPLAHAQDDGFKAVPGHFSHIKKAADFYELRYIRKTGKVRIRWRHDTDTDTSRWGNLKSVAGHVKSYHVYHYMGTDTGKNPPARMCDATRNEIVLPASAREHEFKPDLWDRRDHERYVGGVLSVMVEVARNDAPRQSSTWAQNCEYIHGRIDFGAFRAVQSWERKPESWPYTEKRMQFLQDDIRFGKHSKYEMRIRREAVEK